MLGDEPYSPTAQSVGTHVFSHAQQDSDRFSVLAKGYVVDGPDKRNVCVINAQVALQADHHQVFQMWCLLRSLFTPNPTNSGSPSRSRPPTPPLSPLPLSSHVLSHSLIAPAAIQTSSNILSSSVSLPIPDATKTSSSDPVAKPHLPYSSSGDSLHLVSSAPASNLPSRSAAGPEMRMASATSSGRSESKRDSVV